MMNQAIDATLFKIEMAVTNPIKNNSLKTLLGEFGYDEESLNHGLALLEDAKSKHLKQKKEYGEQYDATDKMTQKMAETNKILMKDVKISRILLQKERGAWEALDIKGRRKKTYYGWIEQSTVFYKNAIADEKILSQLAKGGITKEKLEQRLAMVEEVASLLAIQLKEKGEAQEATQIRDKSFEVLMDWYSDFIQIARVALEDNPQMLEIMGIVQPSE
ncbi:hypothetical protein [Reichenbachiella ulvae]|uniref:Uncharacterized protein n=1 Tax=Reichenbachiella ulvae TaxID=2980104 RepID=A0ABT3CYM8_9BACT|nr:hypothetical protein [Reichenbachiella ulvae]MCV9388806.1 hypothetical protein [Reichenbachiella ulvae]